MTVTSVFSVLHIWTGLFISTAFFSVLLSSKGKNFFKRKVTWKPSSSFSNVTERPNRDKRTKLWKGKSLRVWGSLRKGNFGDLKETRGEATRGSRVKDKHEGKKLESPPNLEGEGRDRKVWTRRMVLPLNAVPWCLGWQELRQRGEQRKWIRWKEIWRLQKWAGVYWINIPYTVISKLFHQCGGLLCFSQH